MLNFSSSNKPRGSQSENPGSLCGKMRAAKTAQEMWQNQHHIINLYCNHPIFYIRYQIVPNRKKCQIEPVLWSPHSTAIVELLKYLHHINGLSHSTTVIKQHYFLFLQLVDCRFIVVVMVLVFITQSLWNNANQWLLPLLDTMYFNIAASRNKFKLCQPLSIEGCCTFKSNLILLFPLMLYCFASTYHIIRFK